MSIRETSDGLIARVRSKLRMRLRLSMFSISLRRNYSFFTYVLSFVSCSARKMTIHNRIVILSLLDYSRND